MPCIFVIPIILVFSDTCENFRAKDIGVFVIAMNWHKTVCNSKITKVFSLLNAVSKK